MKFYSLIFSLLVPGCIFSVNTDSLINIINSPSAHDTIKISAYNMLSQHFKRTNNSEALKYCSSGYELAKKANNKMALADFKSTFGVIYYFMAKYDSSLYYWIDGLKLSEEAGYDKGIAILCGNIGIIYELNKDYETALKYQLRSLEYNKKLNNLQSVAGVLNNIGILYSLMNNIDKELEYYLEALSIKKKLGVKSEIASGLNNVGTVYFAKEEYGKSLDYYIESLEIYKAIRDTEGLAEIYINIGQNYGAQGNYHKSIEYLRKSLEFAEKIDYKLLIKEIYLALSDAYSDVRNYKEAFNYHKLYSALKDSIFTEDAVHKMSELQTMYETEKKEKEIILLNKEKEVTGLKLSKREEEVKKQRYVIYSVTIGLLVVISFMLLAIRLYLQKKKANVLLKMKNAEILTQKEEIAAQRDEISSQRDLVLQQKEEIELIHEELTSSIRYAERIQKAMLPGRDLSDMLLGEHFIIFRPRSIVSGDFYWTMIKKNLLMIAVADCTGHGVPGAFMSMLGISSLNEIVAQNENPAAPEILDKLRRQIIKSLKQVAYNTDNKNNSHTIAQEMKIHSFSSAVRDGMDISLIVINLENNEMQFSGANNSLYIIRGNDSFSKDEFYEIQKIQFTEFTNNVLIEIKGDKMPIAVSDRMDEFSNNLIRMKTGDIVYLFSDGLADQFGGPKGKKFKYSRFEKLLSDVAHLQLTEQQSVINKNINDWMLGHKTVCEQTDDITLLAVKII